MINQEGINSLNTGAEPITYEGTEGPKSPEQDQAMALGLPEGLTLDEAVRTFDLAFPEKANLRGMEKLEEVIKYFRMQKSEGPPLPNDPTEPVNPFGPKPIGPPLPDRQMAAFGGIMGLDNRKQYGIGSKFKRAFNKVTRPFTKVAQKLMPKELAGIAQYAAPFAGPYGPLLMAAGQAKQKGRLNPFSLALAAAPYAKFQGGTGPGQFKPTGYGGMGSGQSLRNIFLRGEGREGFYGNNLEGSDPIFGKYGKAADKFLFGTPEIPGTEGQYLRADGTTGGIESASYDTEGILENFVPGKDSVAATRGILGAEGVVGNLASSEGLAALGKSKLAGAALGKDGELVSSVTGRLTPSMLKLGSWGIGIVSGIKAGKYKNEIEAAQAAEDALLATNQAASDAEIQAARDWAIETFGSMSVYADGGRINKNMGGEFNMPPAGLSSLQTQQSDVTPQGMELDLRGGGFIPIGKAEKADDVPARVSKNEFVFTADAVKAAGGGSVNEGAKRMYDTMKRLESQVG